MHRQHTGKKKWGADAKSVPGVVVVKGKRGGRKGPKEKTKN